MWAVHRGSTGTEIDAVLLGPTVWCDGCTNLEIIIAGLIG